MFTWECTLQAGKLDQPHDDIIETVLMKTMNRETPQLGNRFIFAEIHLLFKLRVVLRQGVLGRGRIWAYEGIAWWLPWVLLGFTKPFAKPYKFRNHQCQQPARTRNSGKSNFDIFKTKQNKQTGIAFGTDTSRKLGRMYFLRFLVIYSCCCSFLAKQREKT